MTKVIAVLVALLIGCGSDPEPGDPTEVCDASWADAFPQSLTMCATACVTPPTDHAPCWYEPWWEDSDREVDDCVLGSKTIDGVRGCCVPFGEDPDVHAFAIYFRECIPRPEPIAGQ